MAKQDPLDLAKLVADLEASHAVRDPRDGDRMRDEVKTAALVSIARSLDSTRVPDHWESLEGASGAILGWFDPQVARAIAQALGASQGRDDLIDDIDDNLEVGARVVLTEAAELDGLDAVAVGHVLELGVSEGEYWALVDWTAELDDEDEAPQRVWAKLLTVVATVTNADGEQQQGVTLEANDELDLAEQAGVTSDGTVIESDDEPATAPDPVSDELIDDIDDDFDTVVDTTPAPDGLAAIRKGKGGKR